MKLKYKGKIEALDHIIISDPSYDEDVTCRYERKNLKEKNWLVDIDIRPTVEEIEGLTLKGTEFYLFLYKDKRLCELKENGTIRHLNTIKINETEIGMDTACVALGINEKAKEIIELRDDWQPECSLNTLTDGLFGTVKEGNMFEHPVFIWLSGYLDEDTGYSIEEIIDYLKDQLNITELKKEITNPIVIRHETMQEKMNSIALKFKEITKEDKKLINYFGRNNGFYDISFAGTYLAGIDVRNEERRVGKLDGEIEKSPFTKEQEKLIDEYTKLQIEMQKLEQEIENDIDI